MVDAEVPGGTGTRSEPVSSQSVRVEGLCDWMLYSPYKGCTKYSVVTMYYERDGAQGMHVYTKPESGCPSQAHVCRATNAAYCNALHNLSPATQIDLISK